MAVGFPLKTTYANGDVYSASNVNDTNGTVNLINPTAKGDLFAGSAANTYTKLSVGTNSQVITADSTATTGLAWKQQGMTFISRSTFAGVSSQIFDSVFSSTYRTYVILIESIYGSINTADLQLQFRYGTTTVTAGYYGSITLVNYGGSQGLTGMNNANQITLMNNLYNGSNNNGSMNLTVTNVGNSNAKPVIYGTGFDSVDAGITTVGAKQEATTNTYTGFLLKASSGTIEGAVSIYGLAVA